MSEWISCEDRLPKIRQKVLCWVDCPMCRKKEDHAHTCLATGFPKHGVYIDCLVDFEVREVDGRYRDVKIEPRWSQGSYVTPNVTHWMELPTMPEVDGE